MLEKISIGKKISAQMENSLAGEIGFSFKDSAFGQVERAVQFNLLSHILESCLRSIQFRCLKNHLCVGKQIVGEV